jgi:uncharacterized membrane protein
VLTTGRVDRSRFGSRAPLGFDARLQTRRYQRLGHALRRRRRLRLGLLQLIYVVIAIALALLAAVIDIAPEIEGDRVAALLFSLATGLIAVIAVVFSLLFLVVPYANTSLTPRLTLFRDDPVVWRSFAYFVALFVYCIVGALVVSEDDEVSFIVVIIALLLALGALGAVRTLQFRAFRTLQLGATLMDVADEGTRVLEVLYTDEVGDHPPDPGELPPVEAEVRWPRGLCTLRQIDLPELLAQASGADALVELRVAVGDELRRDVVVFAVRRGADRLRSDVLLRQIEIAPDRSFDQDPLFAFRILVDITLRALSSAVNDPITAVQAIGGIHQLLHTVADRDLDIGRVGGPGGTLRVVLKVPTWDDYLVIGVDELIPYVAPFPQARQRLAEMVDDLVAEVPPSRRAAVDRRQREIAALAPEPDVRGS